ncbi:helix-turn-helix transcriptional regulator [Streptomyces sp. NPDC127098]|uniref:helix-turn-helix transcriptional regulator n=1 Tax=Streptomyces sp. NPDC127098 TaxID=3347137 RepID=UPI003649CCE3
MVSDRRSVRRAELRDFLRTRRARLAPVDVGLPSAGRRRTPGLRREEVAMLAGVGVSWYTWLEQGRDINVSPDVLDAIGRALRLDGLEREYLYRLAGLNPPSAGTADAAATAELRRLIDAWTPRPALLLDRYWNIVARNEAASAVFGYDDADHNCLVSFFTSPRYRSMNEQWSSVAPGVVATFRAEAARHPGDAGFRRVVVELREASRDFEGLWARHDVAAVNQAVKVVRHPDAGALAFDTSVLSLPHRPGLRVELHNPRPGTGTGSRLARLSG